MSKARPIMGYWLPRVGWRRLPAEAAVEIGLEQALRWEWWGFTIEWLNYGLLFVVRPGEERKP